MPEWITTIEAVEMAKMIMEKAERQRAEFAQRQADAMKCAGCEELRTDNARLRGLLREAVDMPRYSTRFENWRGRVTAALEGKPCSD